MRCREGQQGGGPSPAPAAPVFPLARTLGASVGVGALGLGAWRVVPAPRPVLQGCVDLCHRLPSLGPTGPSTQPEMPSPQGDRAWATGETEASGVGGGLKAGGAPPHGPGSCLYLGDASARPRC